MAKELVFVSQKERLKKASLTNLAERGGGKTSLSNSSIVSSSLTGSSPLAPMPAGSSFLGLTSQSQAEAAFGKYIPQFIKVKLSNPRF